MNSIVQTKKNNNRKNEIVRIFATNHGVRILDFEFLTNQRKRKKCCQEEERVLVYQKEDCSLGKIRFCCENKLLKETQRIARLLEKTGRNEEEIYKASYNLIRGSIGQIILQASFGINTRIYARENELIKEYSILRNLNYLLESCDIKDWNQAIETFQKLPNDKSVGQIIKLYSPLFRNDEMLISKMAGELILFLENTLNKWKGMKKRVAYGHLGAGIVVEDALVSFKFSEKKLGLQKNYFEQLYRNYRSICRSDENERKRIRKLAIFSPITNDFASLDIEEASSKWGLEKDFNRNFTLWQLKNYINVSKNNIFIADRIERGAELAIETKNPFFERLRLVQKNEE